MLLVGATMRVTWYPKNVLVAGALLALFAAALRVAIDFRIGAATGLLALMAYMAIEMGLIVNPDAWSRRDRP
jgi:hypothetical protein